MQFESLPVACIKLNPSFSFFFSLRSEIALFNVGARQKFFCDPWKSKWGGVEKKELPYCCIWQLVQPSECCLQVWVWDSAGILRNYRSFIDTVTHFATSLCLFLGHLSCLNINSKERDPLLMLGLAVFREVCPSTQELAQRSASFHSYFTGFKMTCTLLRWA